MGATYFYLPEGGLLVTAYWGRTQISESEAVREARALGFARHGARAHVIDLSELEGTTSPPSVESATFRALGDAYVKTFGLLPTVVIATRPHIFGQARIFETVVGLHAGNPRVAVVRSWHDAAGFLGLDLAAAAEEIGRRRASEGKPEE